MSHADVLTSADGTPLKISLARSLRRQKWTAFALVAPLLVFLLLLFAAPIGQMLYRGISNGEFANTLPETTVRLENWDHQSLPDEETFAVFATEVRNAAINRTLGAGVKTPELPAIRHAQPVEQNRAQTETDRSGSLYRSPRGGLLIRVDRA